MIVGLLIVACLPGRTFETRFEAIPNVDALPVALHDETGMIAAVQPASTDFSLAGVTNPPGRPDVLLVSWVGGMCDSKVDLQFVRDALRYRFMEHTDRASACLLAGIFRTLRVQLTRPVAAEAVDLVSVP